MSLASTRSDWIFIKNLLELCWLKKWKNLLIYFLYLVVVEDIYVGLNLCSCLSRKGFGAINLVERLFCLLFLSYFKERKFHLKFKEFWRRRLVSNTPKSLILWGEKYQIPWLEILLWQVCNLVWSKNVNELVSTHGYSQNQIIVWRYPTMSKVT